MVIKLMRLNMKKALNIIIGLAAIAMTMISCQKEELTKGSVDASIVGEWHLNEVTVEGTAVMEGIDVYLCINSDCTFELYQKSGTQSVRYDKYTGTCRTEDGILTGVYSNGKPWGGKYVFKATADVLTLKTTNLLEEQKYQKTLIPSEVKENANLALTKATGAESTPIL